MTTRCSSSPGCSSPELGAGAGDGDGLARRRARVRPPALRHRAERPRLAWIELLLGPRGLSPLLPRGRVRRRMNRFLLVAAPGPAGLRRGGLGPPGGRSSSRCGRSPRPAATRTPRPWPARRRSGTSSTRCRRPGTRCWERAGACRTRRSRASTPTSDRSGGSTPTCPTTRSWPWPCSAAWSGSRHLARGPGGGVPRHARLSRSDAARRSRRRHGRPLHPARLRRPVLRRHRLPVAHRRPDPRRGHGGGRQGVRPGCRGRRAASASAAWRTRGAAASPSAEPRRPYHASAERSHVRHRRRHTQDSRDRATRRAAAQPEDLRVRREDQRGAAPPRARRLAACGSRAARRSCSATGGSPSWT